MKKHLNKINGIGLLAVFLCVAIRLGGGCKLSERAAESLRLSGRETVQSGELQPQLAQKILRFHVLANSDSVQDQKVKERVRDAVGSYLKPRLSEAETLEESRQIVESHLDGIIETAERTLRQEGKTYGADAFLTRTYFPVKTYGSYTFPEGDYEALEVVLGAGDGQNWWCVLYPNLCFRGSVYETAGEDADKALREVLSPQEYRAVFDSGQYKIRWKFLEYFK